MHAEEDLQFERVCKCGYHLAPDESFCGGCGERWIEPAQDDPRSKPGEQESRPKTATRIIVAKCFRTRCIFAHTVPQKGVDPDRYAVQRLVRDIQWLGHSRVILRSDNDPAIVKLLSETLKDLKAEGFWQVAESHPPIYDPASNGAIEVACKSVGGMLRTLGSDLEDRILRKVPVTHPIFAWFVEHASWVLIVRPQLADGKTPHQHARGVRFGRGLLYFGENHLYKVPAGHLKQDLEGKLAPRWKDGVFLGYSRDSHEYAVWDVKDGTVRMSRTLQRVPADRRFSQENVSAVAIRPKDLLHRSSWRPPKQLERRQRLGHEIADQDQPSIRAEKSEGLTVTKKDLERHCYTLDGCKRCEHMYVWGNARGCHVAHSAACRRRISEHLAETPEGRERLRRVRGRQLRRRNESEADGAPTGEVYLM